MKCGLIEVSSENICEETDAVEEVGVVAVVCCSLWALLSLNNRSSIKEINEWIIGVRSQR